MVSLAAYPMYISCAFIYEYVSWMYTDTAKNAILLIFNRGSELWPRAILETIGHRPKCEIQKLFILIWHQSWLSTTIRLRKMTTFFTFRWPWPMTYNSENNITQWGLHIQHVCEVSEQSDQKCGVLSKIRIADRATDTHTTWTLWSLCETKYSIDEADQIIFTNNRLKLKLS